MFNFQAKHFKIGLTEEDINLLQQHRIASDCTPKDLRRLFRREWGLNVNSMDISFPKQGNGESVVCFVCPDKVVKIARNNPSAKTPHVIYRLLYEQHILDVLSNTTDIGVEIPNIVHPTKETAMFAMTRISGIELGTAPEYATSDWLTSKIATFIFNCDKAITTRYKEMQVKPITWRFFTLKNKLIKLNNSIPSFAAELHQHINHGLIKIEKTSSTRRFMHDDINNRNVLIDPEKQNVGIIDFGGTFNGDPNFSLAYMSRTIGVNALFKIAQKLNTYSESEGEHPWVDIRRLTCLVKLLVIESALDRIDKDLERVIGKYIDLLKRIDAFSEHEPQYIRPKSRNHNASLTHPRPGQT